MINVTNRWIRSSLRTRRGLVAGLAAGCVLAAVAILIASLAGGSGGGPAVRLPPGKPLPAHVYAPYYETYRAPDIPGVTATAGASGVKYFTLAFLQSAGRGSCAVDWNGSPSQPLDYYASDIASLRAAGGDVIPSFGGYAADQGGTEIADSCTDVHRIAAAYESVITTLGVTRLDMDVEARSITAAAGIGRRNQAIALTEKWAAARGIPLQVQYTLPAEQYGLSRAGRAVLRNAAAAGATVTSVNLMVFDYFEAGEGTVNMGRAAIRAATNAHAQLASIYPGLSSSQVWNTEALTMMPGIDDYPKKTEVMSLAGARSALAFARSNGLNLLSIWAIQRDNGACPRVQHSTCSGVAQRTWAFSHELNAFTGG